jgi:hypothetical protein
MAKSRKKAAAPEPAPMPKAGDKVTAGTDSIYDIAKVHHGGNEVDLEFPETNFMRLRACRQITYVERRTPARSSNPFTSPEPTFDAGEVLERIATVKQENLKRLDDDIDILKAYLKTQHAPMPAIEALEGLTVEQHVSWKKAVSGSRRSWNKLAP